jgi:hypothetical protein
VIVWKIKKVFSASAVKLKAKTYVVCNHLSVSPYNNLLELKRTELKALARTSNISNDTYNAKTITQGLSSSKVFNFILPDCKLISTSFK